MAQPFKLTLSDGVETVDFMSTYVRVANGGFDIGMPTATHTLGMVRPGFYSPLSVDYEYRSTHIKFHVAGETRANIIAILQKIERILRRLDNRARPDAGINSRGELVYAWDGSTNPTYFEVYGGDLQLPNDILSVEKLHARSDGMWMLPEVELILQVSAYGYGTPLTSDDLIQIPLYNPTVSGPTLDPVRIQNVKVSTPQYNYVDIAAGSVPGSQPYLTKLVFDTDTPYSRWVSL